MSSPLTRRRAVAAGALYGGTVFGIVGTILAARILGPADFGRFAVAVAAAGFFGLLLDTTVEEAVVKFGFRYRTSGAWGRLRQLFRAGLAVKWAGGAVAGAVVAALAPASEAVFGETGLAAPLLVAALIPLAQAPEGIAGASLIVAERYDLRASFTALGMALRLVGLAVGAPFGVTAAIAGLVVAQALASAAAGLTGRALFRRYPREPARALGEDRAAIVRFTVASGVGTSLVSARQTLAPLLLGVVSTPTQAGYFRIAQAPLTGLEALSAPVRLVLLSEQTRDVERGDVGAAYRTLRRYTAGAAVLAAVIAPVFWLLMPWLVRTVYGGDYAPATDAARLLLLAACLRLVLGWSKTFPVSIGRPALRIVAHGAEVAVLAPLLVALGAAWDATGAAAAVLAATAVFGAVWAVLLVRLRRERRSSVAAAREALSP
jgi:PST family polysaccharide transporter